MTQASPHYGMRISNDWHTQTFFLLCFFLLVAWIALYRKMERGTNIRSMLIDTVFVNEKEIKEDDLATVVNGTEGPISHPLHLKRELGKPARLGFVNGYGQELPILTVDDIPVGTYSAA
jgi:hypothetical protein